MKLLVVALLLTTGLAQAQVQRCDLRLRHIGVYFNSCPVNSLVESVDARGGNGPFINTYVRCVEPQVVCRPTVRRIKK